jgi:hypothetical protein
MKLFSRAVTVVLFIWLSCFIVNAEVKAVNKHTYLFFTNEKINELETQIKQDTVIKNAWLAVLNKADAAAAKQGASGPMDELALAYRITGDQKYAAKIKAILLAACNKTSWESAEMLNRQPAWHSGLGSAGQLYTAAVGFDCIYDFLSPKERKTIADAIVKLGIKPTLDDWLTGPERIHSLNSMGHNWWSAAVFMAGVASMAIITEEPYAKDWSKMIARASLQWFNFAGDVLNNKPRTFDRDGAFYESIGYADFAMKEYLLFRLAYNNTYGEKPFDIPVLNNIGDFFINSSYPNSTTSMMVNFGDSHVDNRDWYPILLLIANGYQQDRYITFLNYLQKGLNKNAVYYYSAFGLVYNMERNKKETLISGLPNSKLYSDIGWGLLRSSWKDNATMLAIKSGTTWNHAHADANSFILFHNGENLLADGGTNNYGDPAYSDYFFQSRAHNVVLFNGEGQSRDDEYYGVKTPGKLYDLIDAGDLKYIYGDATGPTSQNFDRNYRHFLWIGNVILIIDDLKAHEPGKMEWVMHYNDFKIKQEGLDMRVSKGKAYVLVRPLFPETLPDGGYPHDFPEKLVPVEKEGVHDHSDKKETYLSIVAPGKIQQTKWITAIMLPDANGGPLPKIEKIQGHDMQGVKITQNGTVTNVYLNILADGRMMGRNSNNSFDGWETDSYLTAITYPQNEANDISSATRYFVANGSYLRKNGKEMINSLSKLFIVVNKEGSSLNVQLQGQPLIEAELYAPGNPRQILLNNEIAKPIYRSKGIATVILADRDHQAEAKQLDGNN